MITCSKVYKDIPFAHRQHLHDGACSKIHGHNWQIKLTFGCTELNEMGFVIDFGRLKLIKNYIQDQLDHACVLSYNDPLFDEIVAPNVYKIFTVENASCEGLAEHLFSIFADMILVTEGTRAFLYELEIWEDSKNSVKYRPATNNCMQ